MGVKRAAYTAWLLTTRLQTMRIRWRLAAPEAVERRVWRNIFAVVAIAVVIAALTADLKFMLGLVFGRRAWPC